MNRSEMAGQPDSLEGTFVALEIDGTSGPSLEDVFVPAEVVAWGFRNPWKWSFDREPCDSAAYHPPVYHFSAMDSTKPEDLWTYLEKERAKGNDNLAIPHNGNLSNGRMFQLVDSWGAPISAEYAVRRMENEPLFEMMQLKGTSETTPSFAPEDEFADFELLPYSLHSWQRIEQQKTSYVREAYKSGLRFQQTIGANPFKLGLEGGGDDHG